MTGLWRWLLGGLLLANVFVALVWSGQLDGMFAGGREPERLARQAEADRLRVLAPGATAARPEPERPRQDGGRQRPDGKRPDDGAARGDAGRGAPAGPAQVAAAVPPPPMVLPGESCSELGPFEEARAQRVRSWLAENVGVLSGEAVAADEGGPWLVYLAPAGNAGDAQLRLAALRKQGVQDLYVMQEGPLRFGISLGLFRSEEGARSAAEQLTRQGVRNVLVSRRGSAESRTVFRIRYPSRSAGDDNGPVQRLAVLQRDLGVEVGACGSRPTVAETLHR